MAILLSLAWVGVVTAVLGGGSSRLPSAHVCEANKSGSPVGWMVRLLLSLSITLVWLDQIGCWGEKAKQEVGNDRIWTEVGSEPHEQKSPSGSVAKNSCLQGLDTTRFSWSSCPFLCFPHEKGSQKLAQLYFDIQ